MSTLLFSHKISSICICYGSHTGFLVRREEKWRTVGSAGDGDQTPLCCEDSRKRLMGAGEVYLSHIQTYQIYVCVHTHMCTRVYSMPEASAGMSSSVTVYLIFKNRISHWSQSLLVLLGWLMS